MKGQRKSPSDWLHLMSASQGSHPWFCGSGSGPSHLSLGWHLAPPTHAGGGQLMETRSVCSANP